jgi:hypothetical protein
MRTILASLLLAAIATTAGGCIGCSAYSGSLDKVYARGSDQMILCENGAYAIDVAGKTLEGFYTENAPGSTYAYVGTDGASGTHAWDLAVASDGTATSSELGTGSWQELSLDKTALDHADTRCQDLATRSWYAGR